MDGIQLAVVVKRSDLTEFMSHDQHSYEAGRFSSPPLQAINGCTEIVVTLLVNQPLVNGYPKHPDMAMSMPSTSAIEDLFQCENTMS